MINPISGKQVLRWYPKVASTLYTKNSVVRFDGAGAVVTATNAPTDKPFVGLIIRDVTATDIDYATTAKVPVVVPLEDDTFEADVTTGILTPAMVGTYVNLDATGTGIDVTSSAQGGVFIDSFLSATKAIIKINATAQTLN